MFILLFLLVIFFVLPMLFVFRLFLSIRSGVAEQARNQTVVSGSGKDKIALVNVDGLIVENGLGGGFGAIAEEFTSAREIKKILKDVAEDENIKALLVRVNSPGGSAVASEEIYSDFLNFKKKTNKKIVVYFSDVAASGGYYVAMAGDKIVANPSTITGSIGVVISYLNFQEVAEKYGIKHIVYKTGPYKDLFNEFKQPTKEEDKIIEGVIHDSFGSFIKAVSEGRRLSEKRVRELADGRIYSAKQAKELSLVDKVGNLEVAISEARDIAGLKSASVVELGQPSFWELVLGGVGSRLRLPLFSSFPNIFEKTPGIRILFLYAP